MKKVLFLTASVVALGAAAPAFGADLVARPYTKAPPMLPPVYEPHWTVWGAAYGGGNQTNGDPVVVGSHDLSARTAGFATGFDYRFAPNSVVGFALAGGTLSVCLAESTRRLERRA